MWQDEDESEEDELAAWEDPDAADVAEEPAAVRCPHCGGEVFEEAEWCPHCGEAIGADAPRRKPWWLIVLVVVLVIILAGLLWR